MLLIKHMTKDSLFCKQLGWTRLQSNFQQLAFLDLFVDDTACFATSLELSRYIYATYGNWDNYKPDKKVIAGNKKNDKEKKDMEGLPDDSYALYGVYN